jgi:hypothetical protein
MIPMRQFPLTALILLTSAPAASADYYHVRHATYACVDPQATSALDPASRHAALPSTIRRQGRCFWVRPREHWQQVSHPTHSLWLLRRKPPHPGEPPLYFKGTTIEIAPSHRARHVGGRYRLALSARPYVDSLRYVGTINFIAPPARLQIPGPISWVPAPAAATTPVLDAAPTVTSPMPQVMPRDNPAQRFAPLLVWAMMIATVILIVRRVSRRRQSLLAATSAQPASSPTGAYEKGSIENLRRTGWNAGSRSHEDVQDFDATASNGGMEAEQRRSPSEP